MVSIRQFTIYLNTYWQDLITKLSQKPEFSFQDFYRWFRVTKVSKEEKNRYVQTIIDRLLINQIIKKHPESDLFSLRENGLNKVIEEVLRHQFRDGGSYYTEKDLLSIEGYQRYFFRKKSYFQTLFFLINEYWKRISYWENLNNKYGQIIYFVRAEYYYNKIVQSELEIEDYYKTDEKIREKKKIRDLDLYPELKNHFEKCTFVKCRKCGGNILNLIKLYIERVKHNFRSNEEYQKLVEEIKKLAYAKKEEVDLITFENFKVKIDSIINPKDDETSKESIISSRLNFKLKRALIDVLSLNRYIIREYGKKEKEKYSELIGVIELYRKHYNKFINILAPTPLLDNVNSRIIEEFLVNEKIYKQYNKTIRNLGREGEKRIYEGLEKDFPDDTVIWNNKDGESGKPYDILLTMKIGEQKYIEVKTTHTDQRGFEMSEAEFQFALDNSEHYKIYLIINFGKGPDTYIEEVENFKEMYQGKGALQLVSRKFKLV